MSLLDNLKAFDPFADASKGDSGQEGVVHVRIQQRNGRKTLTTVQGLSAEFDFKKIVKVAKKEFACNGSTQSMERSCSYRETRGRKSVKCWSSVVW